MKEVFIWQKLFQELLQTQWQQQPAHLNHSYMNWKLPKGADKLILKTILSILSRKVEIFLVNPKVKVAVYNYQ